MCGKKTIAVTLLLSIELCACDGGLVGSRHEKKRRPPATEAPSNPAPVEPPAFVPDDAQQVPPELLDGWHEERFDEDDETVEYSIKTPRGQERSRYEVKGEDLIVSRFDGRGTRRELTTFRAGKKNGPWAQWWKNGEPRASGEYREGKKEGLFTYRHASGKLDKQIRYKDDVPVTDGVTRGAR